MLNFTRGRTKRSGSGVFIVRIHNILRGLRLSLTQKSYKRVHIETSSYDLKEVDIAH
jgi:hypothetical protein